MSASVTTASITDVLKSVAPDKPIPEADVDLFEHGVLDSFATIAMVAALEEKFEIALEAEELTMENFQTLNSIVKLVERHQTR